MARMFETGEITKLLDVLIGKTEAVGETNEDKRRLDNLKTLIDVTNWCLDGLQFAMASGYGRPEYSMAEISYTAQCALDEYGRWIADVLDEQIADRKTEPTISKMEQVDKDINVRSKTEPQTIRCPKCGRSDYIREFGKDFSVTAEEAGFKYKCINCNTYIEPQSDRKTESNSEKPNNCETCRFELYCPEMCEGCCEWDSHYEPKDEPQTMVYPQVDGITPSVIAKNEPQITKVGMATDSVTGKVLGVTLDTDCAWK